MAHSRTIDEFRAEAQAFLDEHASRVDVGFPDSMLAPFRPRTDDEERAWVAASREWQRTLFDHGFTGLTWPADVGGHSLSIAHAFAWVDLESTYDVPRGLYGITHEMIGPTLLAVGTPEQRAHCRAMLTGEEVWCQLFSEPGSGSDLAGATTRAVPDGESWRVSGQKVWTSEAGHARYGYLLARTDPDVPKHRGLTAFVLDMHQPGVEVRPLRQMTGGSSFCEIFLDDARLEPGSVLGTVGGGWNVAMTTLGFERFTSWGRPTAQLLTRARAMPWSDPVRRQALAGAIIDQRILSIFESRLEASFLAGAPPGPEGALAKLAIGRLVTRIAELVGANLGASLGATSADDSSDVDDWALLLLTAPAFHIAGGTDEILKTMVAERVLGLPKG